MEIGADFPLENIYTFIELPVPTLVTSLEKVSSPGCIVSSLVQRTGHIMQENS